MKFKIPVLTYHDVSSGDPADIIKSPIDRLYTISAANLDGQADFITANGYKALALEEFLSWKWSGKLPAEKAVLLTFDDGHSSNFRYSFPLLAGHGLTAVYFITAANVERDGYVSWAQLSEMAGAGNSIGSHGLTHSILRKMPRSGIERELKGSKTMLEDKLGFEVSALSIPRGFYDEKVLDVARESGYKAVFTSDTGYNYAETGLCGLRRIVIRNDYSLNDFKAVVGGDLRFRMTRELESTAKMMLQKILGMKGYDSLKTRYLIRRGI